MSKLMKAVLSEGAGGPEVLSLGETEIPETGPDEVLIEVTSAGVNGPDLMQRRGLYPPPKGASPLLGLEVSGKVAEAGGGQSRWKAGDAVCALTNGGGYAEFVAVKAEHCLTIPESIDPVDAGGLCETYFTVWSNVFHGHDLPAGAIFLVHGGAGGIGSTAIQLGAAMGLRVFTTVDGPDAAEFATSLGAERAIDFREEDFVPILREAGGALVTLDIIGGDYIARNIKAAHADGRIINLAFNKGSKVEIDLMPVMLKRLTLTGSTLRSRPDAFKSAVAAELQRIVWPKFEGGTLRAVTDRTYPLGEAAEAHRAMESGTHRGKILLTP